MIDLHTHTTASDGTLTPTQLMEYAISKKLTAIAITDHDTIDGLEEASNYLTSQNSDLKLIKGIEFSTCLPGYNFDIHILGFNIDPENEDFRKGLSEIYQDRKNRNVKLVKLLSEFNYPITMEDLESYAGDSVITRAHIASVLVQKGYFKTKDQVFKELIGNGKPAYIPRTNVNAAGAIDLINRTGGVSAIAHPTLYGLNSNQMYGLISELKDDGLMGIESFYCLYDSLQHKTMRNLAAKFDLIEVGGSDYHGNNKPGLDLGNGYGNLHIPDELLNHLIQV